MPQCWLRPLCLAVAIASVSCRKESIDKPKAPAMDDIVQAFTAATGTFDAATARTVRTALDDAANGLLGAGVPDRLFGVIQGAIAEAEKDGANKNSTSSVAVEPSGVSPRSFGGEGFGRVTRICDGWAAEPQPLASNGKLALTITFTEEGIDPVVWGDAAACLYLVGQKRLRLDHGKSESDLRLHVGQTRKVAELATTPVILALDVTATLDDKPIAPTLAVRFVYQAKSVELLVPVPDGSVIVTLEGTTATGVRAKNGTFQCDAKGRCTAQGAAAVTL